MEAKVETLAEMGWAYTHRIFSWAYLRKIAYKDKNIENTEVEIIIRGF